MTDKTNMNRLLMLSVSAFLLFAAPAIYGQEDRDASERAGDATEGAVKTAGDGARTGMEAAGEATETGVVAAGDAVETGLDATGRGVGEAVEQSSRAATTGARATAGAARTAGRAIAGVFGRGNNRVADSTIRAAQQELKSQGYYGGEVDGIIGPVTRSALREFQSDHDLQETARLDEATLKLLDVE